MLKAIKLLKQEPSFGVLNIWWTVFPTTYREPHFISDGFWIPLARITDYTRIYRITDNRSSRC